jgi:hypothetical protein
VLERPPLEQLLVRRRKRPQRAAGELWARELRGARRAGEAAGRRGCPEASGAHDGNCTAVLHKEAAKAKVLASCGETRSPNQRGRRSDTDPEFAGHWSALGMTEECQCKAQYAGSDHITASPLSGDDAPSTLSPRSPRLSEQLRDASIRSL